ncbi:MAG: hypothetical protein GXP42_17040 [Chloroflexi bacterium]|nr:hypothetical protein [Chloroflexota bacterium]
MLRIFLLGTFQVMRDAAPITGIESNKGRALLAFLAVEAGKTHTREALATMFWPDELPAKGRQNLRQALYNLRQALDPGQNASYFLTTRQTVQFNPTSPYWLDVWSFRMLLHASEVHPHRQVETCAPCIQRLREAIELYQGEFLAGFSLPDAESFEEWVQFQRIELGSQALRVLDALALHHERRREYKQAADYRRRQIEIAAWHEPAHIGLMRVLALDGQHAAALRQFEVLRETLREEMAAEPSAAARSLLRRIRRGELALQAPDAGAPYKGLHAFAAQDVADFYGRERFIQQLLQLVERERVIGLIGASGSGKTSLIQAGLLPRLRSIRFEDLARSRTSYASAMDKEWLIVQFRPGANPIRSLIEALNDLGFPVEASELAAESWRAGEGSLCRVFAALNAQRMMDVEGSTLNLLVIVDQFEELYTLCQDMALRRRFLDALLTLADESSPFMGKCVTLFSLRAAFMGEALSYRPLADAIQQGALVLGPMNREELRQVIEEPARARGARFEPGLVERLLDDVGDQPGHLPLLEFALTLLWEQRRDGLLTHAAYDEIGGVAGALASYADRIFFRLAPHEQTRAQRVLLRMIHPGENAPDARRVVTRAELGDEDWLVVEKLADARLVVTDRTPTGEETAEVAHEALIRNWKRLREWLEADRRFRLWHARLHAALEQWEISNRDSGALLRGAPLEEASAWLQRRSQDLSAQEQRFIQASIALHEKEQSEAEARREREVAQAKALAEAERRRAEIAARARRRLRWLAFGLAVLAFLAILAALDARNARSEAELKANEAQKARSTAQAARLQAEEAARQAKARQLSAQAVELADERLDLAILLSLESLRFSDEAASRRELLTRLELPPLLSNFLYLGATPGKLEGVVSLVIDGDNDVLTALSLQGTVKRWRLSENRPLGADLLTEPGDEYLLSPKGGRYGVIRVDQLSVYDVEQPGAARLLRLPDAMRIDTAAFLDERMLILVDTAGHVYSWDVDADELQAATIAADALGSDINLALSPDGAILAVASNTAEGMAIRLFDWRRGVEITSRLLGPTATVHDLVFSADGRYVAAASFDETAWVWDTRTGEPVFSPLQGHEGRVLSAAFSPDGRLLATGGTDNRLILWDLESGEMIAPPLMGHSNWVRAVRFSANGELLFSGDADGRILRWNLTDRVFLKGHEGRVRSVALSPDGGVLLTSSFDGKIMLRDAVTGELLDGGVLEHGDAILQAAYSPAGDTFASGDVSGGVILWDANERRPLHPRFSTHGNVLISLAYSPDGRRLASGDFDGVIAVRDVVSGELLASPVDGHDGWALSLAFSPDGRILASGGTDNLIRFWDADTLTPIREPLVGHENWVTSLLFSPDGRTLISTSSDRTVRFWDVGSGREVGEPLLGHDAQVWQALFWPPDGARTLVTLGSDGGVIWWDMSARSPIGPALHTGRETESMAVSPDGKRLYLGSFDNKALIWRVQPKSWEQVACAIANRALNEKEWRKYVGAESYDPACSPAGDG